MPKNWKLKPEVPKEICEKIPEFSTLAAQLLYNRGLTDKEQIQKFIDPKYEDQNDPHLFKDMRKAVDRIWTAIENNEGICIYGDYDADAVTANSVVQLAFLHLGVKVGSYIPDRFTEGYGLNIQAFETIRDQGCKVVITVDCGTNSTEVAEFCNRHNIDLIITDHHEIIGELPKAYALINPKNPNDSYPYHEITGVGVAFKLMKAVLGEKEKIESFLSLQNSSAVIPAEEGIQKGSMDPGSESGMTQQDKVAYVDGYERLCPADFRHSPDADHQPGLAAACGRGRHPGHAVPRVPHLRIAHAGHPPRLPVPRRRAHDDPRLGGRGPADGRGRPQVPDGAPPLWHGVPRDPRAAIDLRFLVHRPAAASDHDHEPVDRHPHPRGRRLRGAQDRGEVPAVPPHAGDHVPRHPRPEDHHEATDRRHDRGRDLLDGGGPRG